MTTGTAPAPTRGTPTRASGGLAHLPVSVFATVMGLGGTALAWQRTAAFTLGVVSVFTAASPREPCSPHEEAN